MWVRAWPGVTSAFYPQQTAPLTPKMPPWWATPAYMGLLEAGSLSMAKQASLLLLGVHHAQAVHHGDVDHVVGCA